VGVVRLNGILLETAVAGEVPGVLAEDPLVEVSEDRVAISVLGNNLSLVLFAALAGGLLGEPLELTGGILTVVPPLTAATPCPCSGDTARTNRRARSRGVRPVHRTLLNCPA